MARSKKTPASKGMSGGTILAALLGAGIVGYLLLKPKAAAAAPTPPVNPTGANKTCADGSVVAATSTCMRTCPDGTSIPEGQPCKAPPGTPPSGAPKYTVLFSGSQPAALAAALATLPATGLSSFPLFVAGNDPNDPNPVPIANGDALVFLQGFNADGSVVFPGTTYPNVVLKGGNVGEAVSITDLMDPAQKNLADYFTPGTVEPLEAAGSHVLVWSTNYDGTIPLGWWLMTWSA